MAHDGIPNTASSPASSRRSRERTAGAGRPARRHARRPLELLGPPRAGRPRVAAALDAEAGDFVTPACTCAAGRCLRLQLVHTALLWRSHQADLQCSEVLGCLPAAALDDAGRARAAAALRRGRDRLRGGLARRLACTSSARGALEVRRTEGMERYVLARLARVTRSASSPCSTARRGPRPSSRSSRRDGRDRRRGPRRRARRSTRRRSGGCSACSRGC